MNRNNSAGQPVAPVQRGLWFLHKFLEPSSAYNVKYVVEFAEHHSHHDIQRALDVLVDRHDALRSRYFSHDGDARFETLRPGSVSVPLETLKIERLSQESVLREFGSRPFELERQIPIRALYLEHQVGTSLLLVIHHLATDGGSFSVLRRDLLRALGEEPSDPFPPQYSQWAREQVAVEAAREEAELNYWRDRLEGCPEECVPTPDFPRGSEVARSARAVRLSIPPVIHAQLLRLAARERATLFMLLHAALLVVLARRGAGSDIVVGASATIRPDEAVDRAVGYYLNSIALRTRVEPDSTFEHLLSTVRTTDLGAFENSVVPFDSVVRYLNPRRNPARHPLFQVMLGLQVAREQPFVTPDAPAFYAARDDEDAKFDLSVNLTDNRDLDGAARGLGGQIVYSPSLFSPLTAERLAADYVSVLETVVRAPETTLREIWMHPQPRPQIEQARWAPPDAPATPAVSSLTQLLLAIDFHFRTRPDDVVLWDGDQAITYRELGAAVRDVLAALRTSDGLVALLLARSLGAIAAILACLVAGRDFAMLDPGLPVGRVQELLTSSKARVVISDGAESVIKAADCEVVDLSAMGRATQQPVVATTFPSPFSGDASEATVVIFSSGSTGASKGIELSTIALSERIMWFVDNVALGRDDVALVKANPGFDVYLREVLWPLASGAQALIVSSGREFDASYLVGVILSGRVTAIQLVPTLARELLRQPRHQLRSSLRWIVCSGEPLTSSLAAAVEEAFPTAQVVNVYGSSEAGLNATVAFEQEPVAQGTFIGYPVTGADVYIVDDDANVVAPGVVGEIHVGGNGIARNYRDLPASTPDPFAPAAFSGVERIYRTGDMGRYTTSGGIEFLGRRDRRVKLRGNRVDLYEVESIALAIEAVEDCACLVDETLDGASRLVLFVVPRGSARPHDVLAALSERIPGYMLPTSISMVDVIPKLPNGKLDLRRLPRPEYASSVEFAVPRTDEERLLCDAMQDVLGADRVGANDNFFEIGGHSLLVMRLTATLAGAGTGVRTRDIFDFPTPRALARHLWRLSTS